MLAVAFWGTHKGCPYDVVLFRADTPVPPLRNLYSFGHPQGMPLQALFVAVVFYVRARVFKLRPCFRGAVTK